ncbi:MAG: DUF4148 domain-containing protein [Roseateles sp.]
MLKKLSVVALSLIAASAAMAQGLSREQVLAELQRARAAGEIARVDSESYSPSVRSLASTKTRAEVVAELERARATGELAVLNSDNPSQAELQALQRGQAAAERLAGQPKRAH